MAESRDAENHHLIGGILCLDFANTLYGHAAVIHEYLFDSRDLVLWSRHAGVLSSQIARTLLSKGEQAPGESEAVFCQATQLRESIFRILDNLAHDESPQKNDLTQLRRS